MAFVLYRSPGTSPGRVGESLRTNDVREAWARIRRFLAEHTDDPPARSTRLHIDAPVDDDGGAASSIVDETAELLGESTPWRSDNGEHGWEWSVAADKVPTVVDICEQHEMMPRIHLNEAVRRHGSPPTPQVWGVIEYLFALRCGVEDRHVYRPGWGQSQLRAYLGFNKIWLVLHLPFDHIGMEVERTLIAIETTLDHTLSRKRLRLHST